MAGQRIGTALKLDVGDGGCVGGGDDCVENLDKTIQQI